MIKTCACGCGKTFDTDRINRKYKSEKCRKKMTEIHGQERWAYLRLLVKKVILGKRTIRDLRSTVKSKYEWRRVTAMLEDTPNRRIL